MLGPGCLRKGIMANAVGIEFAHLYGHMRYGHTERATSGQSVEQERAVFGQSS